MIRKIVRAFRLLPFLLVCSCSGNLFTTFSNQDTDASLLESAQLDVNNSSYAEALLLFPQMSTSYQAEPAVISLWAAAYAGEAGLNTLSIANNLNSIGSTPLFLFLLQNLDTGSTTTMADMLAGQNRLLTLGANLADYTSDEVMELVLINMGNLGVILSAYADTTPRDSTVDTTFNPCDSSQMPDTEVEQFGVSLNLALAGLTQLEADGITFGPTSTTAAAAACTTLAGAGPPLSTYDFCGVTSASGFTANQILGIRSLIKEGSAQVGIGNQLTPACTGSILTCHC